MSDPIEQLVDIARRIEPADGYFGPSSLVDALEANVSAMDSFRSVFATARAEQLDALEDQPDYGWIIVGAADALDLLPDDPRMFKSDQDLATIPDNQALDELRSACIVNDTHAVEVLAARADVNALDHHRQCPLCYAVGNNHIECARILLANGANPNRVQNGGNTPLHICATSVASKEMFQLLLDSGGSLDIKNEEGKTPVELLSRKRRQEWMTC